MMRIEKGGKGGEGIWVGGMLLYRELKRTVWLGQKIFNKYSKNKVIIFIIYNL